MGALAGVHQTNLSLGRYPVNGFFNGLGSLKLEAEIHPHPCLLDLHMLIPQTQTGIPKLLPGDGIAQLLRGQAHMVVAEASHRIGVIQ